MGPRQGEQPRLEGVAPGRGVPAVSLGMRSRLDARGLRRALGFASPRPDAVVTRGVSAQLVGAAIARRAQAPHVLNEHTPLTPAGRLVAPRPHQRALTRQVAPHVDAVIAVTERQAEPLAALGYRREGIEVIANGVFTAAGETPPVDETGAAKLLVTHRALTLRRDRPELFTRYGALPVFGDQADSAVAADRGGALTFATRLPVALEQAGGWGDTVVLVQGRRWRDVLTGRVHEGGRLRLADVLDTYPVALLVPAEEQ